MRILAGAAITVALAVSPAPHSSAAVPTAAVLDNTDQADLGRIEEYLNRVKTVRARFVQVSSTGELAEGDFYMLRPGKMRIEYQPPVPVLIVSDGTWLIYYDRELGQVSYLPLGSTPAGLLVANEISLRGGAVTVTGFERDGGTLRVTMVRTEAPDEGSLALVFSDNPMALRKWSVVDAQGIITNVSLVDARFDVPLDAELFRFRNPNFFNEKP